MSKTELQTEWVRRIANFKASGQTQTKWCVANDMKIHRRPWGRFCRLFSVALG